MKELMKKFFEELGMFIDLGNPIEPEQKVKKSEKIISEMNEMEKGLYTFICKAEEEHENLMKKVMTADKSGDQKEIDKLKKEHSKNHRTMELARKIMWASIENRIDTSEETTGTGIRKGFKVVERYEENETSGFGMMIPGVGAIISIGGRM